MIKIFSIHTDRTDFLSLGIEQLNYFCLDKFEYHAIDNFKTQNQKDIFKKQCDQLNIHYHDYNQLNSHSKSSTDHANALNYIKNIANDEDINVILEFDIFMINYFSFFNYIDNYNVAGIYQQRNNFDIEYLAPFIIIVNSNQQFSNINFSPAPHTDCGGSTHDYIRHKKVKWMEHTKALCETEYTNIFNADINYDHSYGCQLIESSFLHYYKGSNWNNANNDYIEKKTQWLKNALLLSKHKSIINKSILKHYQTIFSHAFANFNGSDHKFQSLLNPYL